MLRARGPCWLSIRAGSAAGPVLYETTLDALVLVSDPTFPGCRIRVRTIGVFHMEDEKGPDEKLLCVPLGASEFERVADIHDVQNELRDEIEHFFQRYKDLEPSKRTETRGWGNRDEAETILAAARERA